MLQETEKMALLNNGAIIPLLGVATAGIPLAVTKSAVLSALLAGYRHIDCAPPHEAEVGQAFREAFSQGMVRRDEVFVTSKLPSTAHEPQDVLQTVQKSLSDLQLEYLDLYLIHWPLKLRKGSGFPPRQEDFLPLDIKSTWEALEHTVELGLTRAIGVANFSSKRLESLLQYAKIQPAVDQVEMHPGWQQQSLRYFCRSRGIHVSAMAPLGAPGTFYGRNDILILQVVLETAMRHRKTPAQVALRWALQQGVSVLPKSSSIEHMVENCGVWGWELTGDELERFHKIEQSRFPVPLFPFTSPQLSNMGAEV
ncbi:unnamed protein product [Sphagnum troendelagicum]